MSFDKVPWQLFRAVVLLLCQSFAYSGKQFTRWEGVGEELEPTVFMLPIIL